MSSTSAFNGPIAGENSDDVIMDCSTPTNQSARTCVDMTSLETIFVNIQGLLNMAIERSRDREQQISYEKASLKIKAEKERELRDSVCKQLVEGKRTIETLQRRLKHERKSRRRLQLQLQRCTGANLSPPSEARSHYSYSSCSAGGSTDSDDAQPRIQSLQQEPAERSSFAEHESGGTSGSECSQRSPACTQLDMMLSGKKSSSSSTPGPPPGFVQQISSQLNAD